jgi:hypothetical protein
VQNTGDGGKKRNCGCGVCAAYKSYNITGALEVAVAAREGWRIRTPGISARPARGPSGAGFDPPPPAVFAQGAMTSE